jgi:hypothetical protein
MKRIIDTQYLFKIREDIIARQQPKIEAIPDLIITAAFFPIQS